MNHFEVRKALSLELQVLHSQILECRKCELCRSRTKAVPGEGPDNAKVMFVGEGPGEKEDEEGRPFVGAAGKFLTELLDSIGISRSEVFITNIVKCRPPANRPPRQEEIVACNPYLEVQMKLIQPQVVCPLGTPSIKTIMGPEYSAAKVHGKPFRKDSRVILPLYHPAAALYDAKLRDVMFEDIRVLRRILDGALDESNISRLEPITVEKNPLQRWA